MIKILFLCHGNICRSPMCESVFTHMVKEAGLADRFLIDSAATSTEEIGNPVHWGTVNKLKEVGIPLVPHRAKQIQTADYDKFDYIIGMDTANIRNLNRMLKGDPKGRLQGISEISERQQRNCLSFLRCIVSCTLASINQWIRENVYPLSADGSILQNAETQEKLKDEESTAKSSDSGD